MIHPLYSMLPELEPDEMAYAQSVTKSLSDEELKQFVNMYRYRRKDPQIILLTCLGGFLGFAGIHRILLNQIGMGILYLLTAGFCFIGTIIDLVNYKSLTFEYNQQRMHEVISLMQGFRS
ncbi:MAG: TM2 domain-containing protein [Bacteroidales bacterium]|nr:TM2 domain-containing protein [Bacteroidales bacterium]MDD3666662.1 TM2 domain-containing protein [Bacteroidales bacterium]